MNHSLLRRLRALELLFPEPPPDLSDIPLGDLEALEQHMAEAFARGDKSGDWESALPARLRRILRRVEPGQSWPSRKSGTMAA
jgi:hypothetical protein